MKPRIWPIALWAGLGIVILCALGMWQLVRLAEKQALLAEIAQRATAPPVSLGEALALRDKDTDVEFVRVKTKGVFDNQFERHKLATFEGSPGWQIVTPFTSDEGIVALVDRGVVSDNLRNADKRPAEAAPVELTAIIRSHNSGSGFFDPENDIDGNVWYWWDVPAMLSSIPVASEKKVAPFVLQALPGEDPTKFPRASSPEAQLRNKHLQYAGTWFFLALTLLVIAGLFIRKQLKRTGA